MKLIHDEVSCSWVDVTMSVDGSAQYLARNVTSWLAEDQWDKLLF